MKVVVISPYCDPAGVGLNLTHAINNFTGHSCIGFARQDTPLWNRSLMDNYYVYGEGAHYDLMISTLEEVDVIHYNHTVDFKNYYIRRGKSGPESKDSSVTPNEMLPLRISAFDGWPAEIDLEPFIKKKITVFHGHGGIWLLDPTYVIEKCKSLGIIMATCSPIDEVIVPGIKWVPNILPLGQKIYNPIERDFSSELVCSLASNEPLYKGGAIAEYVFEWMGLVHDNFDIRFEFVSNKPLNNCLIIRKAHHFTIDNWLQGFHGMAALEGLAFGHVVFSRFDPMAKEKWGNEFDEPVPIVDIKGMDELAKQLRIYNDDRDLLKEKILVSRKWMEDHYTEEQIVTKWIKLYGGMPSKKKRGNKNKVRISAKTSAIKWCIEEHDLVPDNAEHIIMCDLSSMSMKDESIEDTIATIFGEPKQGIYIVGKIPCDPTLNNEVIFATIYAILKIVENKWELHKFFKRVSHGGRDSSFFSLKPRGI